MYLVGILGIDVIFYGDRALFGKVLRRDLDEIGDFGLGYGRRG